MPIINSVIQGGGTTPTGTKYITTNGVHNVSSYANADVQVPTTAPECYRAFRVGDVGELTSSISTPFVPLPAGAQTIVDYLFYRAYEGTPANVLNGIIDLSSLTYLNSYYSCYRMFCNCPGITSVNLSSLESLQASSNNVFTEMFASCTALTSVNLSSLLTVGGVNDCLNMFSGCTALTSVDISSLKAISGNAGCKRMFYGTGLTNVTLSSLDTLSGNNTCEQMFGDCTALTSLSFPALKSTSFGTRTSQFNNMLSGVTGCTVHFPSNLQSVIGSWASVTAGFGGTNITVLYDLPATE